MTDPLPIFANHLDGLYRRFPIHQADDAVKLGWIPVPETMQVVFDLLHHGIVWLRWLECACGRGMPVPR